MKRILVVEDSSAMRGLIASIVEADVPDCEVVEVESGFAALRQLPRDTFDLIITDINMPDINGLELLSFIRKSPRSKGTPVLIVTSESSDADRERGMALGANAYLSKPFEPEALVASVQGLLERDP